MALSDIGSTPGTMSFRGDVLVKKFPAQLNDPTHVGLFPDAGRLLMMMPNGDLYTDVGSVVTEEFGLGVSSSATLVKQSA